MGKVKRYLEHALEVLQVSHEEVESMSLSEIDTLLKNHEESLMEAMAEIETHTMLQEWADEHNEGSPIVNIVKE